MSWDLALVVAGHALSFASFSALFLLVVIGRRSSPHRVWVLAASGGTAIWAAGTVAAALLVERPAIIPFLEWARIAGWLCLMLALLSTAAPARVSAYRRLGWLGVGTPLVAIAILTIAGTLGGFIGTSRIALLGEGVVLIGTSVFGLALVETLARWMSARGRTAAIHFFLGIGLLLTIDLFLYAIILLLGRVDIAIYEARGFLTALAAPLIAVALARQRDWLIDIHLSRQVMVNAATLMGAGLYLLAMALAGLAVRELNAAWGPALHITFLAGALVLLASILASEGFRPRLNALVSRHFYSAKYDYRREWLRFSDALSRNTANSAVEERLLSALLESVACRNGALWLKLENERDFAVAAARPTELLYVEEPCSALHALMQNSEGPVALADLGATRAAYRELARWSSLQRPWAAVPLRHRGALTGFLVLGQAVSSREPDAEDREFLQALCVQAAAHLAEERSAIVVGRSRRFETTARQMAYIGHDLKNIVSQFSMVLQNWTRHRTNEAFLAELPDVVGGGVQRMKALLERLKEETAAAEGDSDLTDVNQCLAGLLPLWRARYEHLVVDLDPASVVARGRRDHLQSIFDQLVSNAIEASDEKGHVTLSTRLDGTRLLLEVSDCGTGISEKSVAGSRFDSGTSAKAGGHGIGLFQVRDYLHGFGGSLSFICEPGGGTTVKVSLPVDIVPLVDVDARRTPAAVARLAPIANKRIVAQQ